MNHRLPMEAPIASPTRSEPVRRAKKSCSCRAMSSICSRRWESSDIDPEAIWPRDILMVEQGVTSDHVLAWLRLLLQAHVEGRMDWIAVAVQRHKAIALKQIALEVVRSTRLQAEHGPVRCIRRALLQQIATGVYRNHVALRRSHVGAGAHVISGGRLRRSLGI